MSNTCQDPECRDVQLWMVSIAQKGERLPTDTCYDNHVPVLPFSHDGQDGLHDVHVGKEIDLEDLIHQADSPITLG